MTINVDKFKIDQEELVKSNLLTFFDKSLLNIENFYKNRDYIYNPTTLQNDQGYDLLEVILTLHYLDVFSKISGQAIDEIDNDFFAEAFNGVQIDLVRNFSNFVLNRIVQILPDIKRTMQNSVLRAFLKNVGNKLNEDGYMQIEKFNNFDNQSGIYAQKVLETLNRYVDIYNNPLKDGVVKAKDIVKMTLSDHEKDLKSTKKQRARRDESLGSIFLINQKVSKKLIIDDLLQELKRNFDNSKDLIALTETEVTTEGSRDDEVSNSNKFMFLFGTSVARDLVAHKRWKTMQDDRVRHMHRLAEGQEKPYNEPYVVGGQYLMHPGDTSLGATMNNIANCRCRSEYFIL